MQFVERKTQNLYNFEVAHANLIYITQCYSCNPTLPTSPKFQWRTLSPICVVICKVFPGLESTTMSSSMPESRPPRWSRPSRTPRSTWCTLSESSNTLLCPAHVFGEPWKFYTFVELFILYISRNLWSNILLNGNISKSIQCMVLLESRHLCTTVILYIGLWTNVNYNLCWLCTFWFIFAYNCV